MNSLSKTLVNSVIKREVKLVINSKTTHLKSS